MDGASKLLEAGVDVAPPSSSSSSCQVKEVAQDCKRYSGEQPLGCKQLCGTPMVLLFCLIRGLLERLKTRDNMILRFLLGSLMLFPHPANRCGHASS